MSKKVSDILPKTEILAQLAEEASELAQAALKLHQRLCQTVGAGGLAALDFSDDRKAYERIGIIASEKYYRWLHRLQDKEQSDE